MSEPNNPLTIFISSTFSDLAAHREVVNASIRKLRNHANDMISWSSDDRSAERFSIEDVKRPDLLLLILAHKYGSIVPGDTISFTEFEFLTAKKHNKPVLAFFVDTEYPWPPKYIETDMEMRKKLESFKNIVEKQCVCDFFTTPESLAVLVTQAIANFDKRYGIQKDSELPDIKYDLLIVKSRKEILFNPDINVLIGQSPDELPLILNINRSHDFRILLSEMASKIGRELDSPPFDAFERILNEESHKVWCQKGIYNIELLSGGKSKCYVSYTNLSKLFSPSLIRKVISMPLGYVLESGGYYNKNTSENTDLTSLVSREGRDNRVQSTGGNNRFIALSVNADDNFAVGWSDEHRLSVGSLKIWRNFINESLLGYSDIFFRLRIEKDYEQKWRGEWDDIHNYPNALINLCQKYRYDTSIKYIPEFAVSLGAIIKVIIKIAEQLNKIHKDGIIHGDVKPQNILLSREKPVLIDSLSLKIGELPPAVTPGWAAPEQIMLKPVNEASDIFPLGLMLVNLLDGQLTGELLLHVIPQTDYNSTGKMISFFKNPFVFINPDSQFITKKARKPWLDFIEKCLRYSPGERTNSALKFINELKNLLSDYPLNGHKNFTILDDGNIGLARLPNGDEKPCRILFDSWPPHKEFLRPWPDAFDEDTIYP